MVITLKIYSSLLELTGNTPLVNLKKIEEKYNIQNTLLAKVEMFNPSGSVKVRPAKNMILKALHENIINTETTIIEATSGNMGIALAFVCAILGMRFIAVMPSSMSIERRKLIQAYGAEIILTEPSLGMNGAVIKAMELKEELNGFIPSQFDNQVNPLAHYDETAEEILHDTDNTVDIVVAGVGTGGTISGIGRRLKENKQVIMVGVEPTESQMINEGKSGPHKIQGIGANFIPKNLDLDVIDEVIDVSNEEAFGMARELARLEGMFVGISSGAALFGTIKYIKKYGIKDKKIVVILPDTGERYLSSGIVYDE